MESLTCECLSEFQFWCRFSVSIDLMVEFGSASDSIFSFDLAATLLNGVSMIDTGDFIRDTRRKRKTDSL